MNGIKLAQTVATLLQDQYLIQQLGEELYDSPCVLKLLTAMNSALSEVSAVFPIYRTAQFESVADVITYGDIDSEGRFNVVSVTVGGESVPYTVDHVGIHLDRAYDGKCEVIYSPELCDVNIDDDFDVAPEVGFYMLAYIVARNYCIMSGRMEEAAMYDSQYNDCAEKIRLKRMARIPARKFV